MSREVFMFLVKVLVASEFAKNVKSMPTQITSLPEKGGFSFENYARNQSLTQNLGKLRLVGAGEVVTGPA